MTRRTSHGLRTEVFLLQKLIISLVKDMFKVKQPCKKPLFPLFPHQAQTTYLLSLHTSAVMTEHLTGATGNASGGAPAVGVHPLPDHVTNTNTTNTARRSTNTVTAPHRDPLPSPSSRQHRCVGYSWRMLESARRWPSPWTGGPTAPPVPFQRCTTTTWRVTSASVASWAVRGGRSGA